VGDFLFQRILLVQLITLVQAQAGATKPLRNPGQNYCAILESSVWKPKGSLSPK